MHSKNQAEPVSGGLRTEATPVPSIEEARAMLAARGFHTEYNGNARCWDIWQGGTKAELIAKCGYFCVGMMTEEQLIAEALAVATNGGTNAQAPGTGHTSTEATTPDSALTEVTE